MQYDTFMFQQKKSALSLYGCIVGIPRQVVYTLTNCWFPMMMQMQYKYIKMDETNLIRRKKKLIQVKNGLLEENGHDDILFECTTLKSLSIKVFLTSLPYKSCRMYQNFARVLYEISQLCIVKNKTNLSMMVHPICFDLLELVRILKRIKLLPL